jgi:putative ABC transport system permease protein
MNETLQVIPLTRLALAFIPVCAVLVIIHRWSLGTRSGLIAVLRMVGQLLLVGYALTFIFESNSAAVVVSVVSVMLATAGWIALRPLNDERRDLYPKVLIAISLGAMTVVVTATQGVLALDSWHNASVVIPLAGIVLSNSMNTVSLAAERFQAERRRGAAYRDARRIAMKTALIPMTNSLLAVGLVSLPGMMTGQILSGVSPIIAVRYQILVMCMIFGSAGLATSCFLVLQRPAES